MDHELIGLSRESGGSMGRLRPVGGIPCALLVFAVALLPVRPAWLWATLIGVAALAPWIAGAFRLRRPQPYWRLSARGLEHVTPDGRVKLGYQRNRIDELAVTSDDGMLTIFHKFGRTRVGELSQLGFEPAAFFVTARRLGLRVAMLDGDSTALSDGTDAPRLAGSPIGLPSDEEPPPPDRAAQQRLLDLEADLLGAAHEPPVMARSARSPLAAGPGTEGKARVAPARWLHGGAAGTPDPGLLEPAAPGIGRARVAFLGVLAGLLGTVMVARTALEGTGDLTARMVAGLWALAGMAGVLSARRRILQTAPVRWIIRTDGLRVSDRTSQRWVRAQDVAALVVGPGLRSDPLTGSPVATQLSVLAFDHRLRMLARLPAHGLDAFQLSHTLDDHGYRVVAPGARTTRPSEYGLDGLPEIFSQVPGGRLIVAEDGLGWADAAGDVVLKMPQDRIGGIELLTIDGHAWLRVYDSDGDEFFAAPLSVLRISRTDLRESAERAGLPITDAEYDAYLSAAFHGAVSSLSTGPPAEDPQPAGAPDTPTDDPAALLDATRRSRVGTYGMSVVMCEVVGLLGAGWLGEELGGFALTAAWTVPAGLLIGLGGSWLYDRNRAQLRISKAGISVVTRLGRVEWHLGRETVGGIGIDDSDDRLPRLVVWSPAGRVLRRVSFPPDLAELRRACERFGLPWGPPDAGLPTPPPPEL